MNLPSPKGQQERDQEQKENNSFSGWLQFLTGLFFWLFMVLATLLLPLDLYGSRPIVTVLLLLLLAVGGSFYAALPLLQALPALIRFIIFFLIQWGALLLWVGAGRAKLDKSFLFPWLGFLRYPRWWIPAVITWWGGKKLGRLLFGLQRRPLRPAHFWAEQWEEKVVDLTFWIIYWRNLQRAVYALLGIGVVGLALSPHLAGPLLLLPSATGRILLWLLTGGGLLLLMEGYYCYKQAFWHMEGLELNRSLCKEWRIGTGKILLFLSILTWLLPGDCSAVGWRGLLWIFYSFASSSSKPVVQEIERPLEVSSSPQGEIAPLSDGQPELFVQILSFVYFLLSILLTTMIVGACFALIGFLLYRLVEGEIHKLRGLPKTLVRFYLFLRRLWQKRRRKTRLPAEEGWSCPAADPTNRARKRKKVFTWGRGPRALIRRGYYRLLYKARQQGLPWQASQTPEEIGLALTAMLPEEGEAVKLVTTGYQEARYGPVDPPREKLLRFERWRRILQKRLDRAATKEDGKGIF